MAQLKCNSDKDLLLVTQIAYYDFDKNIYEAGRGDLTLNQLLGADNSVKVHLDKRLERAKFEQDILKIIRAEHQIALYEEILKPDSPYGQWKLRAIKDDEGNSGFYACLIETNEEQAVLGFRGSELKIGQIKKDWIDADFGLLDSDLTLQQEVSELFVNEIHQNYNYQSYCMSGHSLGGNLALHGAVTAPLEMKKKIAGSVSFDGPGYSQKYINLHWPRIIELPLNLIHYQWSLVGSLLFTLPLSQYIPAMTEEIKDRRYEAEYQLQKHDTCFVKLDQDGMVIPGKMDAFAMTIGAVSRKIV